MHLYIDGDAFPNLLKPIVLKAIERLQLDTTVVSNKKITLGSSLHVEYLIVDLGADEADNHIVDLSHCGDLVITADIPLADRLVTKDVAVIDHRGELYTKENIKQYLAMRNLMSELRDSGEMLGGPAAFGKKDVQNFANQFNAVLQRVF